ncbi:hypothetical protein MAIC_15500 [Mycolicibacterium aichiense]|uniref:Uncharacterized protein n=1 Tax=Mycolicibacterium aichiense TaxID=1799 RepID=A0AAD1HJV7_9MYCO|nr:hypothetical protein [Mycolicibacterium aichiense]BBX06747.1 hypothetical protein MAIC_15500 [Mycolicibacterium aichiense]
MPVSESYPEADGALTPDLVAERGATARIGDGEVFMEVLAVGVA